MKQTNGTYSFRSDILLDWRGAAWFAEQKTLVFADAHFGYEWTHRFSGQMMPLTRPDQTAEIIRATVQAYEPVEVVLLGDIIHGHAPVPALEQAFKELVLSISAQCRLTLIRGNHDRQIDKLLANFIAPVRALTELKLGPHLLFHGDSTPTTTPSNDGVCVIGHEHPAINLGDGIKSAKFPCFLGGKQTLVLPALSPWAAGTPVGSYEFMSEVARKSEFTLAVAILGQKLLPLPIRIPDQP